MIIISIEELMNSESKREWLSAAFVISTSLCNTSIWVNIDVMIVALVPSL